MNGDFETPDPDARSSLREMVTGFFSIMVVLVSIIPLRRAALSQGVDVTGVALTWSGIAVTVLTIIRPRWFHIPMSGEYAYPDSAGVGNHVL